MHCLKIGDPVFGKFQTRVERSHAIARVGKIAAGKKTADVGLLAEFARHARHSVHRPGIVRTAGESLSRLPVIDDQRAERPFAEFARHAAAELRVGNLAREKQVYGGREKSGVLNKKRAFFRKTNSEGLVDRDLRIVRFDLAEIRIQGNVKRERVFQHELGVQPGAVLKFIGEGRWRSGIWRIRWKRLIEKMVAGKNAVGDELNIAARRDIFDSAN